MHFCPQRLHEFKSKIRDVTTSCNRPMHSKFSILLITTLLTAGKLNNSTGAVVTSPSAEKHLHTISTTAASHCVGSETNNVTLSTFFFCAQILLLSIWLVLLVYFSNIHKQVSAALTKAKPPSAGQSSAQAPAGPKPSRPSLSLLNTCRQKTYCAFDPLHKNKKCTCSGKPDFSLILLAQALEGC